MNREAELRKEIEKRQKKLNKDFLVVTADIALMNDNQIKVLEFRELQAELKGITETKEKIIKAIEDLNCEDYTIEVEERDKQIIKLIGEII